MFFTLTLLNIHGDHMILLCIHLLSVSRASLVTGNAVEAGMEILEAEK
jgi:hypothetical protein